MKRLILLIALAVGGCASSEPKAWMPHDVVVDQIHYEVDFRKWCDQSAPCDMLSRQDVHWEVDVDGRIKVIHIDKELRFQRGTFNPPNSGHSEWVADDAGEYLLATTSNMRVLVIHYPLPTNEVK